MVIPFTLYDNFEYTGAWFLPSSKEKQVVGTMKYQKGRFELETIGSITSGDVDFGSALQQLGEPTQSVGIILGFSTNGTKITMTRCHKTGARPAMGGLTTYRYSGHDLYVGYNFDKEEDIQFDTVKTLYSNLNAWYPKTGISFDISEIMNGKLKVEHVGIEPIEVKIDDNFKLGIEILSEINNNIVNKEFEIKESTLLTIKSKTAKHHKEFQETSNCYRYFLMLSMANTVHPIVITAWASNDIVNIFPGTRLYENIPSIDFQRDMLFSYSDIANDFETFIQSWKKLWDTYKEIMDVYFSTLLNSGLATIEIQFLRIAQALEAYQRRKFPEERILSDEEYEMMIADMQSKLSDNKHALKFISRFKKDAKWPSFEQRLHKLVDMCPDVFNDPVSEKSKFALKVSKTRNYHTHISEEIDEYVVTDPHNMIYLTHEMMALMEGCLLTELPFQRDKLREIIIKNRNIKNYAREHPLN